MPVAKGDTIDVERTRGKLLRAGAELFYAAGTTVGINDIAARAGVSKLTIYRHFGSKDGLLGEVLAQRSDRVHAWLRDVVELPDDPLERILAVFDAFGGWYAEQGFRGCAMVNAATQAPVDAGPARAAARIHLERYRELLAALAADAALAEPERLARQLLILLEGATVVAAIDGTPAAAGDARQAAAALLSDAPRA
jgi:AcrR family transcriptional regulator